jgi:hypothetical protein
LSDSSGDRRDGGFHDADFPAVMLNHQHVAFDVFDSCAKYSLPFTNPMSLASSIAQLARPGGF